MGAAEPYIYHRKIPTKDVTTGLLPCPFCGGEAGIQSFKDEEGKSTMRKRIACSDCGVSGAEYDNEGLWAERDAKAAWNKRA